MNIIKFGNYNKDTNLILKYLVLGILVYVYIVCFPGGWSPDSNSTYLNSIANKAQPNRPLLSNIIFIFLNYISKSYSFVIHYNFQVFLYLFAVFKLSSFLSPIRSLVFLIVFSIFPPFLGVILTFWSMSISTPFLIFAIYFLFLKIENKTESHFLFYINLFLFSAFRWENSLVGGILLFLYIIKPKYFKKHYFSKKKIFLKLILSLFITIIFFSINLFSYQKIHKINYLTNEANNNIFVAPIFLLHLSGKLEQDLIPKRFLTSKIANLNKEERIKEYIKYYDHYQIFKKRKFFKINQLRSDEFSDYYKNIEQKYFQEFNQIRNRLKLSNFTRKATTLYPMMINLKDNGYFKKPAYSHNYKFILLENKSVKKVINKFLRMYKTSYLNYITLYYLLSLVISTFCFFKSIIIINQKNLKYNYFILSLLSSTFFIQVNFYLLSGIMVIEFRYLISSLACLLFSIFYFHHLSNTRKYLFKY